MEKAWLVPCTVIGKCFLFLFRVLSAVKSSKVEGAEEGVTKLRCGDRNEEGPSDCSVWVAKELRLKENLRLA